MSFGLICLSLVLTGTSAFASNQLASVLPSGKFCDQGLYIENAKNELEFNYLELGI